ncbi:gibberellin-regulated protein 1-like [Gastrolobium bilobum]|uniref:gibberellin-regulated protein 1-like n=1 Tax=Gastrolobium bilobum TaxID=150636 RepID=UPI002AAF0E6B|nr:gibberellin-regulated protein 1-like [Gastrolobium bilobum]
MAISKTLFAPIVISLVILHLVESDTRVISNMVENASPSPSPLSPKIDNVDCDGACDGRCQLSSRPNLCKRACGTCCERCNCVPSGTYGHYEECPCYANMTTRGGKHKCP